jgi:MFS family permease
LNEKSLHYAGLIFASLLLFFFVGLWLTSIAKLFSDWSVRSINKNWILAALLFFGTIIGSIVFHVVEENRKSFEIINRSQKRKKLNYKSSRLVRRFVWIGLLAFPLGFIAGSTASSEARTLIVVSNLSAAMTIPCFVSLAAVWAIGIYRLLVFWSQRNSVLNVGYSLLLFLGVFFGALIFSFIPETCDSEEG